MSKTILAAAEFDENRDLALIKALATSAIGQSAVSQYLIYEAYTAAMRQLNIPDDAEIDDVRHAELAQMTLRNLVRAGETVDGALLKYALEIYKSKDWLPLQLFSWDQFLDAALPEESDRKWRHVLRNAPKILIPLAENPIIVTLDDGAQKVVNDAFMATKPSILQDLIPVVGKLDMAKPEDRARFEEIIGVAVTRPREEMRTWLASQGLREVSEYAHTGTVKISEVLDAATGATLKQYHYSLITEDPVVAEWMARRLRPMIFFREE